MAFNHNWRDVNQMAVQKHLAHCRLVVAVQVQSTTKLFATSVFNLLIKLLWNIFKRGHYNFVVVFILELLMNFVNEYESRICAAGKWEEAETAKFMSAACNSFSRFICITKQRQHTNQRTNN